VFFLTLYYDTLGY